MAIYIHRFQTLGDFDNARENDYKEPWVSLTLKGYGGDTMVITNGEDDVEVTYEGYWEDEGAWWGGPFTTYQVTATGMSDETKTITVNGITFSNENNNSQDTYLWLDQSGYIQIWTKTLDMQVGDHVNVEDNTNSDLVWFMSETREVTVGQIDADSGDWEVKSLGGEGMDINRVDYNKRSFPEPEWVDFGLPSGNLWAKYNIGAYSTGDTGMYFAWGETAEKETYSLDNYKFGDGNPDFTKYNLTDGKTVLDPEDDAATVLLGGLCKTPSVADWEELLYSDKVTNTFGEQGPIVVDGVTMSMIVSKTNPDDFIVMPFSGDKRTNGVENASGEYTTLLRYWCNELSSDDRYGNILPIMLGACAHGGGFSPDTYDAECTRAMGCPIRPIKLGSAQ